MDDLITQMWFSQIERSILNEQQIAKAQATLGQLKSIMDEYRYSRSHALSDDALSDSGRKTRVGELGVKTTERLEQVVGSEIRSLDTRIAEVTNQLRPQHPDADPAVEFQRQREIRDLLRAKSELEIVALYQSLAVTGDDDATMRAIEGAPASFPLISNPGILAGGQMARAERQSPDVSKLLGQLKHWRSTLSGAMDSAKAELNLPMDNFLERAAVSGAI